MARMLAHRAPGRPGACLTNTSVPARCATRVQYTSTPLWGRRQVNRGRYKKYKFSANRNPSRPCSHRLDGPVMYRCCSATALGVPLPTAAGGERVVQYPNGEPEDGSGAESSETRKGGRT